MPPSKPIFYESHMHTILCKHAVGTLDEYARQAVSRGLKGMIVTCHCPLPDGMSPSVRMFPEQWEEYVSLVYACRDRWQDQLDVRLGLESDFLPGLEPWLSDLHRKEPLNYVLGSVHPQIKEYRDHYFTGDWPAYHRQYFHSLVEAAESGFFDSLSHPDLVKNLGTEMWDLEAMMPTILESLDRIATTGIAMELNTSGLHKNLPEMNPSLPILKAMHQRGIPVVIGADAHQPERVSANFEDALRKVKEAGFTHTRIFLDRQPVDIPIADSLASLISSQ